MDNILISGRCDFYMMHSCVAEGEFGVGQLRKMNNSPESHDVNKENITNVNKAQVPKLSVEPHQKKRKKKGAGFNLRKSLAWDRAFFTEEGDTCFLTCYDDILQLK